MLPHFVCFNLSRKGFQEPLRPRPEYDIECLNLNSHNWFI